MLRALPIFTFLMTSLFFSSSFAADENVEVVPREEKETVISGSSENHRMGKTYIFNGQVLGFGPNLISSQGLSAGYFLNRNMVVFIDATYGKAEDDGKFLSWDSGDFNIKGASVGVHFKHYVGNSFYYRAGIDYRTMDFQYDYVSSFSPSSNYSRGFKGKSVGATFGIGNQWQFENFNLGCDWVGVTIPISKSISDEYVTAGGPSYNLTDLADDEDDYVRKTSLNLLRFYLGASF
jgi:hypothetical protein